MKSASLSVPTIFLNTEFQVRDVVFLCSPQKAFVNLFFFFAKQWEANVKKMQRLRDNSNAPSAVLLLKGTKHQNVSDFPSLIPALRLMGDGGWLGADRSVKAVAALTAEFFDVCQEHAAGQKQAESLTDRMRAVDPTLPLVDQ